jgi:hypothetical protein
MGLSALGTQGFALESADMRLAYLVFFIGVGLVGMGSAYYHVNPNNATLVWDRLPMTVSFKALLAMILADTVSQKKWESFALATVWNRCRVGWILVCD